MGNKVALSLTFLVSPRGGPLGLYTSASSSVSHITGEGREGCIQARTDMFKLHALAPSQHHYIQLQGMHTREPDYTAL